jgi:hypothetical protein
MVTQQCLQWVEILSVEVHTIFINIIWPSIKSLSQMLVNTRLKIGLANVK